ncbi:16S rRNA (adenine(1518)-N(6)/adenine(1519)-N(6))-dimethyltransferase RsmA [Haloferula sp. A504]|uniref:16S rRNA (adenine(1518)-N(6)/adenine(1519)-N(6))- dimethyltransferase RsmA n=1 Tax=Haloferula sp. A504 TaxID=3373601 RepID=UPI0031C41DEB|nr:16S rRNA (adenine(1518)-N(6)/adenine(1519)-N(6))-dimethyltransferase RsmA [Verrucomicrobiaceae bacterium E54]
MTGAEIREALEQAGVRPNRQLGQNFLCDPGVARWITDQLEPRPEDTVVEVGPGTGALTSELIGRVKRLVLIEFDSRLAAWLKERFADRDEVEVHHADGARFDPRVLWKHRPVKFLGNLPYSAGGAILKNFLSAPCPFSQAVIMLQKEVIDRIGAGPRTKDYGVLTLRMRSQWDVRPLKVIPPEAFHPRPSIDSTVAVLTPLGDRFPVFDRRRFDELIRRGFSQRRKQLRKQMPEDPGWDAVAERLGISATARAEELDLDDWVAVTREYDPHPLKEIAQRDDELLDVVDEQDQVVGQATRAEVHAKKLLHRAVHVFAVNRRGELLLQQRSRLKDVHPGVWDSSVAGHLDAGEDYPAAAEREMAEEMGIRDAEPEEIGRIPPCAATGWEHVCLYLVRWDGRPEFPCSEIESVLWLPPDEIDAWIEVSPQDFASGFLECWKLARGRRS